MIAGLTVTKLEVDPDSHGWRMEMLHGEPGEPQEHLELVAIHPGERRGWLRHRQRHSRIACIHGMIKLVVHDARADSPTSGEVNEVFAGEYNQVLVDIPPGVDYAMKCITPREALMMLLKTALSDPAAGDEFVQPLDTPSIDYDWRIKFH